MEIKLRPYQEEAIRSLKENNWQGILDMATGTGKTFTSLAASEIFFEGAGRSCRLILVPFVHLSTQWYYEMRKFGLNNIIECNSNHRNWYPKLIESINSYRSGLIKELNIVATYKSLLSYKFINAIQRLGSDVFLIADEAHNLGVSSVDISDIDFIDYRLGLSATPRRWWDESGTSKLIKYFDKIVFSYDMEEAIRNGFLTEYKYSPIIIDLNDEEANEFEHLTKKLGKLDWKKKDDREIIKTILMKRRNVINNAKDKLIKLEELIKDKDKDKALFYCTPGNLKIVNRMLADRGIRSNVFNYEVSLRQRKIILDDLKEGRINSVTAIKCLDEGVDVPGIKSAFFLASTSNPREFIQRRGRILRKSEGKVLAEIYDFLVIPNMDAYIAEKVIRAEMPRFAEFNRYSINSEENNILMRKYLSPYGLEYLIDKLPWEVYEEMKESERNEI